MVSAPLSNLQLELLQLYAAGVPDDYLPELKNVIANYLLNKARDEADRQWDARGYDESKVQAWLDPAA